MIRRLILSVAVCLVCVTSRADITNELQYINNKLDQIQNRLRSLDISADDILSILEDDSDNVLWAEVVPLCQSVITALPDLLTNISELRTSVGDLLGNNVMSIAMDVDTMQADLNMVSGNLSLAVEKVLLMLSELEQIREFGYHITDTVQTISDTIDDDVLRNQERIISLLQDIGSMLNWGSDLQSMAEDLAYIRQVLENYVGYVEEKLYSLNYCQSELYNTFTVPFGYSHVGQYSFPFYYAYTSLENPTSPSDWSIDYVNYESNGSPNGILEEIGIVLKQILQGDSNASLMLANIVKSMAHEEISEQSKRDEYTESIATPLSSARTAYHALTGDDGSGIVQVDDRFATPANLQGGIKDSLPNMMDGYTSTMRNFFFPQLPSTTFKFRGFNSFNHRITSVEGSLGLQNFAYLFSGIRAVFGFIYLTGYLLLAFFCLRYAIRGYHFLLSIFAGSPSSASYRS